MASQSQDKFYLGEASVNDFLGDYNKLTFVINQALREMQTCTIVKIVNVDAGGQGAVGLVDVIPMVEQIDANLTTYPQGTIYNIPYLRLQGGANAIIIDPEIGDIGICMFSSKDISNLIKTKKVGAPASYRQFSYSDGLYVGGVLNGAPTNFIELKDGKVTITANSGLTINGNVTINGTIDATGDIKSSNISLSSHLHGGVQTGASNTTGPIP